MNVASEGDISTHHARALGDGAKGGNCCGLDGLVIVAQQAHHHLGDVPTLRLDPGGAQVGGEHAQ